MCHGANVFTLETYWHEVVDLCGVNRHYSSTAASSVYLLSTMNHWTYSCWQMESEISVRTTTHKAAALECGPLCECVTGCMLFLIWMKSSCNCDLDTKAPACPARLLSFNLCSLGWSLQPGRNNQRSILNMMDAQVNVCGVRSSEDCKLVWLK